MINLRKELYNLCQCADGSLPAVDYLQMLDIHSTLPREDRVALIGELKAIIAAIKKICSDDEVKPLNTPNVGVISQPIISPDELVRVKYNPGVPIA